MTDYKQKYEQKCVDYDQLRIDLDDFQGIKTLNMSKILEQEMESKIKVLEKQTVELTQKNDLLKEDLNKTKVIPGQELSQRIKSLEREMKECNQEIEQLKNKNLIQQRSIIELEVELDKFKNLERYQIQLTNKEFREQEILVQELEQRVDTTLEQLAIVQTQLEISRNQSQEQIERLKQKLKDNEDELFATRKQSELMKDRLTKSVKQSPKNQLLEEQQNSKLNQEELNSFMLDQESIKPKKSNENQKKVRFECQNITQYTDNINSLKLNTAGFSKSLTLISTLIKDLDDKMSQIRTQKVN